MNGRQQQHNAARSCRWVLGLLSIVATATAMRDVRGQDFRYVDNLVVSEPTELDWAYAVLGTSPATLPPNVARDAKRGGAISYEFYGPARNDGASRPLLLFVSSQDRPIGWDFCAATCEEHGVLFAGVRNAGNGVSEARRIRAVVETLADVRRRHSVSVERTYLAGFSGGAHIAWRVASALPEQIGGVLCIGYAPRPPHSTWQRQRLAQRLSVAVITGDREPATAWVQSLYGPMLQADGVRTSLKVLARHGHSMPRPARIEEAFVWLDEAAEARAADIKRRIGLNDVQGASREQLAASFLAGAKNELSLPDSTAAGLAALAEVAHRWPDLPAAREAEALLAEYDQRPDKPWLAEQHRRTTEMLQIEAAGHDRLARRKEAALRAQRGVLIAYASQCWRKLASSDDPQIAKAAQEHLAELEAWAAELPPSESKSAGVPLAKVRFELVGDVTLAEAIERFRKVLEQLGCKLIVDDTAKPIIAAEEQIIKLDMPAATFSEVDRRVFRPHGLKLVRQGTEVQLIPLETIPKANPKAK